MIFLWFSILAKERIIKFIIKWQGSLEVNLSIVHNWFFQVGDLDFAIWTVSVETAVNCVFFCILLRFITNINI